MENNQLIVENDKLLIKGEVTFNTTTHLMSQLEKTLTSATKQLDCSGVTHIDSSVIAFLLFTKKLARKKSAQLEIIGVTEPIHKLMSLYGLQDFLLNDATPVTSAAV